MYAEKRGGTVALVKRVDPLQHPSVGSRAGGASRRSSQFVPLRISKKPANVTGASQGPTLIAAALGT
jgi:hypothetical protein